jgi:hypothetical protein
MLNVLRRHWQVLVTLAVLVAMAALPLFADCYQYSNSRVGYISGQAVCMGTGSGCTECANEDGSSCVTTGQSCEPWRPSPDPR